MEKSKLTKNMDSLEIKRGEWLFLDAVYNINSHYIEGGWDKIMEKFPEEIKCLDERLNQYWNQKVITEWKNGIKEYLIEVNYWKE